MDSSAVRDHHATRTPSSPTSRDGVGSSHGGGGRGGGGSGGGGGGRRSSSTPVSCRRRGADTTAADASPARGASDARSDTSDGVVAVPFWQLFRKVSTTCALLPLQPPPLQMLTRRSWTPPPDIVAQVAALEQSPATDAVDVAPPSWLSTPGSFAHGSPAGAMSTVRVAVVAAAHRRTPPPCDITSQRCMRSANAVACGCGPHLQRFMPIESHTPFGLHGVGQAATGATASPPQPPSQSQLQPQPQQQQQQGDEVAELKQRVRTGVDAMDPMRCDV
jgi:hypothetical protein